MEPFGAAHRPHRSSAYRCRPAVGPGTSTSPLSFPGRPSFCVVCHFLSQPGKPQSMSKENTIVARRQSDGTLVEVLSDGSTRRLDDKTDWARLRAMTDEEVSGRGYERPRRTAGSAEQLRTARRVLRARTLRRALSLTQEEFAARYHIPLGTLRDWEQGRSEPDQPARAYLTVIARDPEGVRRALAHA